MWRNARDASAQPRFNFLLQVAEEVALADIDAVVAKDEIRGGDVEHHVRQHPAAQISESLHLEGAIGNRNLDVAIFAAFERARRYRADEVDGLADARLQLVDRLLVVFELRRFDAGQARDTELGVVARDLD